MRTKIAGGLICAATVAALSATSAGAASLYAVNIQGELFSIDRNSTVPAPIASNLGNLGIGEVRALAGSDAGLFAINTNRELYRVFSDGTANLVGPLGLQSGVPTGASFTLSGALQVHVQGGSNSGLFNVNLNTGAATLQGNITLDGQPFNSLESIAQAPEGVPGVGSTLLGTSDGNGVADIYRISRTQPNVGNLIDDITGPGNTLSDILGNTNVDEWIGATFDDQGHYYAVDNEGVRQLVKVVFNGNDTSLDIIANTADFSSRFESLAFASDEAVRNPDNGPANVPLPASALLLLSGMAALGYMGARRRS